MEKKIFDFEEPPTNIEEYEGKIVVIEDFEIQRWDGITKTTLFLANGDEVRTGSLRICNLCKRQRSAEKIPFRAKIVKIKGEELTYFTFKPPGQ